MTKNSARRILKGVLDAWLHQHGLTRLTDDEIAALHHMGRYDYLF